MVKLIAWNLGLVLLGLIVAEAVFGTWFDRSGTGSLNIPRHVHYVRDVSGLYDREAPITYTRRPDGLRGDFSTPDEVTILAVGGSTTNERFIDDTETWTALLQTHLRADSHEETVANAGVDGHSTVGHIRTFDAWFPRVEGLKPRLILVYAGINDAVIEPGRVTFADSLTYTSAMRRLSQYISNNSAIAYLVRTLRGIRAARRLRIAHAELPRPDTLKWRPYHRPEMPDAAVEAPRLDAYFERLKALTDLVREFGAIPVFVTQPSAGITWINGQRMTTDLYFGQYHRRLKAYNETTLRFCAAHSVVCIPLHRELRLGPTDFYDIAHTSASGSRKIAGYLARELGSVLTAIRENGNGS